MIHDEPLKGITCNVKNAVMEDDEEYYEKHDPVKKWQFAYNRSTCFSNNYPEINIKMKNLSTYL